MNRFVVVSDAEFGWHDVYCADFETMAECEAFMKQPHDPYEVLSVIDTEKSPNREINGLSN